MVTVPGSKFVASAAQTSTAVAAKKRAATRPRVRRLLAVFAAVLLAILAAGANVAPTRALATENAVVNGDFEYPAVGDLYPNTPSWLNWFCVDPTAGSWYYYKGSINTWAPVSGWNFDSFAWRSSQSYASDPIARHAKAVEIQIDSKSGNQYSEIVAQEAGTYNYQDVSTPVVGAVYKWSLRHASISNASVDEMEVLIGAAGNETGQNAIRETSNGNGDATGSVGTSIATKVSNTDDRDHESQWETYYGTYEIPSGQDTTRLTFKSIVARNKDTSGNLIDDVTFAPAYPLYYDANTPAGTTLSGTVPLTGKDADGIYENYYSLSETPTLVDPATSGLSCAGSDGKTYHLVGWSKTKTDPCTTAEQVASAGIVGTYEGMQASGTDTQLNKVYAVWATDDAVAAMSDVKLTKTVTGDGAPADATFGFSITVKKADGTPQTGSFTVDLTDSNGNVTTETIVLDANGTATLDGVASGGTATIRDLPNGDTYTAEETTVTTGGVTEQIASVDAWATTWRGMRRVLIGGTGATPSAAAGYVKWPKSVADYMPFGSSNGTIDDIYVPAGVTITLRRALIPPETTIDPSDNTDVNSMTKQAFGGTRNSDGTIALTAGTFYKSIYARNIASFYLDVSCVLGTTNEGRTGTGTVESGSGVAFTNTYTKPVSHSLTIGKQVAGDTVPDGVTFSYDITLTDANGAPVTGSYPYTKQDGSTGRMTLDGNGTTTVYGMSATDSLTIKDLPDGATYTVTESGTTSNGGAVGGINLPLGSCWSVSNENTLSLVIPLNSSTPDAVSGYATWGKDVTSYLAAGSANGTTATISDVPTIPTGATLRLMRCVSTAPDPAKDTDSTAVTPGSNIIAASLNATGGIELTAKALYHYTDDPAYTDMLSSYYLLVDYPSAATQGVTATGSLATD